MTTKELIDTLSQGCPITRKLVGEIILRLKNIRWLEESTDYYVKENVRLIDQLARAEEQAIDLRSEVRETREQLARATDELTVMRRQSQYVTLRQIATRSRL